MSPTVTLVDTIALLDECLADISGISEHPVTELAIDLEGVNLCREGRASLLQIMPNTSENIWIIDITVLGSIAFDHLDSEGRSLKLILQNGSTQKMLYDVRMDADALHHLFGVELLNVYDLQLLEIAIRRSQNFPVRLVSGLGKTIDTYIRPSAEWLRVKIAGAALCFPDKGGSYDVFEKRPLDPRILAYSAQDVALLFQLKKILEGRMGRFGCDWKGRVTRASAARVREAHGSFTGRGQHRALAPIL